MTSNRYFQNSATAIFRGEHHRNVLNQVQVGINPIDNVSKLRNDTNFVDILGSCQQIA